jgi:hypothetical protein
MTAKKKDPFEVLGDLLAPFAEILIKQLELRNKIAALCGRLAQAHKEKEELHLSVEEVETLMVLIAILSKEKQ